MKHFTTLSNIEYSIIDVEQCVSLIRALGLAIESGSMSSEDISNCVYNLESRLLDSSSSLRENFNQLWKAVKTDGN
jgi:hypothetical protein